MTPYRKRGDPFKPQLKRYNHPNIGTQKLTHPLQSPAREENYSPSVALW